MTTKKEARQDAPPKPPVPNHQHEIGPTNTNAINHAATIPVGTDLAGTPQENRQALGPDGPANVDALDTSGGTINDAPDSKDGNDEKGNPIVKDRGEPGYGQ